MSGRFDLRSIAVCRRRVDSCRVAHTSSGLTGPGTQGSFGDSGPGRRQIINIMSSEIGGWKMFGFRTEIYSSYEYANGF